MSSTLSNSPTPAVSDRGGPPGWAGRRVPLTVSGASTWLLLAVVMAVGAYFRLAHLGHLGIHSDEDLSSLSVQAILAKGIPELPSGMIYLRGAPFLYAMAASAKIFGFSEFAMRLPAALFGIATIPLAFVFARALFGDRVGLAAAALLAISVWDVEFARYARMYSAFIFFYVLTLWALWRYRVRAPSLAGGVLCIALAVLTISLHQLGYTLAAAMFYPLILDGPREWLRPRRLAFPVTGTVVTAGFFFVWSGFVERMRTLPLGGSEQAFIASHLSSPDPLGPAVPRLPLLSRFVAASPVWYFVLAAAIVGVAVLFAFRRRRPGLERTALIGTAACCAVGLFNFALLGIVATAWLKRRGLAALRSPAVVFAMGITAAAFAAWLLATVALGLAAPAFVGLAAVKAAMRWSLLNYPHFFVFWGFVNQWPLASVVAAVGVLWAFDRASGPSSEPAAGFLLLAFGTPLVVNGLFGTRYELFRYEVPFDTLFFTFVALGLLRWQQVLAAWRRAPDGTDTAAGSRAAGGPPSRARAAVIGGLFVLLVLGFDLNPVRGLLVAREQYRNEGLLYRVFGLTDYPDFKTPAAYLKRHAAPGDEIIVLDSREMYSYLGHTDYWVRTAVFETQTYERGGRLLDLYVSTPLIMSADALEKTLSVPGRRKWLVASDAMLAETRAVSEAVKRFIRGQASHVVYVGRDGETKIYRFD